MPPTTKETTSGSALEFPARLAVQVRKNVTQNAPQAARMTPRLMTIVRKKMFALSLVDIGTPLCRCRKATRMVRNMAGVVRMATTIPSPGSILMRLQRIAANVITSSIEEMPYWSGLLALSASGTSDAITTAPSGGNLAWQSQQSVASRLTYAAHCGQRRLDLGCSPSIRAP